jgi:hypothetical protein
MRHAAAFRSPPRTALRSPTLPGATFPTKPAPSKPFLAFVRIESANRDVRTGDKLGNAGLATKRASASASRALRRAARPRSRTAAHPRCLTLSSLPLLDAQTCRPNASMLRLTPLPSSLSLPYPLSSRRAAAMRHSPPPAEGRRGKRLAHEPRGPDRRRCQSARGCPPHERSKHLPVPSLPFTSLFFTPLSLSSLIIHPTSLACP